MALGVTFPKNEDVVAFERKNEMLVLLVSKSGTYKKELGNYAGYWLRKMYWKDLHCRGMQISRNALTHVASNLRKHLKCHIGKNLDICRGRQFEDILENSPWIRIWHIQISWRIVSLSLRFLDKRYTFFIPRFIAAYIGWRRQASECEVP